VVALAAPGGGPAAARGRGGATHPPKTFRSRSGSDRPPSQLGASRAASFSWCRREAGLEPVRSRSDGRDYSSARLTASAGVPTDSSPFTDQLSRATPGRPRRRAAAIALRVPQPSPIALTLSAAAPI